MIFFTEEVAESPATVTCEEEEEEEEEEDWTTVDSEWTCACALSSVPKKLVTHSTSSRCCSFTLNIAPIEIYGAYTNRHMVYIS